MRLEIPKKISANAYVYRMGFCYPIVMQGDRVQYKALDILLDHFQEPTRELYYYIDHNEDKPMPKLREWWDRPPYSNSRWFLDTKKWSARWTEIYPPAFWAVFRTEKDQIWAAMLLNKIVD